MKKGIIIFIIGIAIAIIIYITGINTNNKQISSEQLQEDNNLEEIHNLLLSVMHNQTKLINENNDEILFKNFEIPGEQNVEAKEYTFIDLDKDEVQELVIYTTADYGAYIILHYENNKVYGYLMNVRSFENLKTDGSFIGSNGANNNEYLAISFNKNSYEIKIEASYEGTNDIYKINNSKVSKQDIEEYIDNWNKKENVKWINAL